jgi:hypothetical protein
MPALVLVVGPVRVRSEEKEPEQACSDGAVGGGMGVRVYASLYF